MLFHLARLAGWFRHRCARHLLVAGGLGIGLIMAGGTTTLSVIGRWDTIAHCETTLKNLAFILAGETDRRFQTAQLVQTGFIRDMRGSGVASPAQFSLDMAGPVVGRQLDERIAGVPDIAGLALFDLQGKLVNRSLTWPAADINLHGSDVFQALAAHPDGLSFIGGPTQNKIGGSATILFARAATAADGRRLGIVIVRLDAASFERFLAGVIVSRDSSIGLFRSDGVLLARFPQREDAIGRNYGSRAELLASFGASVQGIARRPGVIDGKWRLIAPHGIAHYPLLISVTESLHAALAEWYRQTFWMVLGTLVTEIVLAGTVLLGVRQLCDQEKLSAANAATFEAEAARARAELELTRAREREQRERDAHLQSLRFDTALGNMQQGLLMFDGERRLLVVNARLNELCGLPRDVLRPGMSYEAFAQALTMRGNIPPDDLATILARRDEMVVQGVRTSCIWELSDGRAFAVTHEPMEDGWVATYEDISERRRMDARIAYMARHDALTDLPNRVFFRERLEHALALSRRGLTVALLCLDLDQFKAVNDTLGHPVGDALLQAVGRRLRQQVRETDTLARLGGDEFAVIQAGIGNPADAASTATRLIDILREPFEVVGHQIVIGTSIGIAFAPEDGLDADMLLKHADLALYRAKLDGRGVHRLFHAAMDAELQARRGLELELRAALPGNQLHVFYQPLIDLHRQAASGFEALLRWQHPTKGLVSPAKFIPLAEEIGLIVPIGEWVLRQACAAATAWPNGMQVAVNLSPVQFTSRNLVTTVRAALAESGLRPDRLELEITEAIMLQDTDATLATLHALRSLGVRIAMDDFGTGYSSLSYLRRFPFDRIKIDQSFVRELGRQRDCGAIVRAVVALSHELGIATTAEGVETREQLRALVLAGCSDIQGYLFSPPVAEADIPNLLRSLPSAEALLRQTELAS